jgi:hypothetical protein
MEKANILGGHEAPSCHPCGYSEIEELAQAIGAKMVEHGHHHDCLGEIGPGWNSRVTAWRSDPSWAQWIGSQLRIDVGAGATRANETEGCRVSPQWLQLSFFFRSRRLPDWWNLG